MSYQTYDDTLVKPAHTEAEEEQLQILYDELKPEAVKMYMNYFLARTPAHLQLDMQDLIKDDIAVPPEAPVMSKERENLGAPTHQLVDIDAVAQAAAHSPGTTAAQEARDAALENRAPNPANPGKPLVNVRPGDDGPVIVSVDEANPTAGQAQAQEIPLSEQTREGEPIPETYNNPVDGQYRRD